MAERFLIVDDHEIFRKGIKQTLSDAFPLAYLQEANDAEEGINATLQQTWTVIISDLTMRSKTGLDLVEHVKRNLPDTPVLILSMHPEEQHAVRALKAGAAGYLTKESAADELVFAVKRIMQGRKYISETLGEKLANDLNKDGNLHHYLSDRELQVFKMIAMGKSIGDIADHLSLSISTISTYRSRILIKMDLHSNADLTRYALEQKLI